MFLCSWNVSHTNFKLGGETILCFPCFVNLGFNENSGHDFKAKLSPNPGRNGFEVLYLLPQNRSGVLTVYDLQGRVMHRENLPQWSTLQAVSAGNWAPGIYQVVVESGGERGVIKWVKY